MLKISACVIVKNEAKNILRWLQCVKQLADEWIVVDTGSTDNTVELAENNGARVYHFSWCNDFAVAKNFALDKAKGDWIVFLDADEYFLSSDCPKVKNMLKKYHKNKLVVGFICKLVNIDVDNHNAFINSVYQIRLFRNMPHLKFQGHIHEELFNSSGRQAKIEYLSAAVIYHTGYSGRVIKSKLERNLEMIKAEIAKRGEQPKDYFYLTDCYSGLQDYENTVYYARKAIEANLQFVGMDGHVQERLITALILMDAPKEEVMEALSEAMVQYPDIAKFSLLKGIWLFDHKYYLEAEEWLDKGLAQKAAHDNASSRDGNKIEIHNVQKIFPLVCLYKGHLAQMQKKEQEAQEWYQRGLQENRYHTTLLKKFLHGSRDKDTVTLIQTLNKLYDKQDDADFLLEVLRGTELGEVCLYYDKNAQQQKLTKREKYLFAGNIKAAGEEQLQKMTCRYQLIIWLLLRMHVPAVPNLEFSLLMPESMQKVWHDLLSTGNAELNPAEKRIKQAVLRLAGSLSSTEK